ncbi:MAG: 4-hydroxyphenylpyruvate dioxygenase [Acidimicrobiaceae bacterium]|jgi:4-hydroxyphenylpyruvate dioxygenase|nr:4-hydroxyphenylpyruvate dioxygenase [Acidimicrobiaceae bacterium]
MTTARTATRRATRESVASQLLGWDHLEWWVGDARAMAAWLCSGFGFEIVAHAGPETGRSDRVSYVLAQGDVRFVVTAGLSSDSEVSRHVLLHGDGVRNLAWRVDDASRALELAERSGAAVIAEPATESGESGSVTTAAIATYGETRHVFVDRSRWAGVWGPGFDAERLPPTAAGRVVGLVSIDHVVGNVEEGRLDEWVAWYEEVLGFEVLRHFGADQISTQYSALRSTVVHNGAGIVMPINEPAPGLRRSQITEYLESFGGPGVQHIALATPSIVTAVAAMVERGVRFLDMPPTYYEDARLRCAEFDLPWSTLERLGIEVDKDVGGYLLQIFSEMVTDRPTVFIEIIQREGATGFGEGNFKALFEAIEREQARRGNL